ncbi:MAG: hypothetical protein IPJ76_15855 [Flavobacteriales bacterium]|nr:MAG: hypothetical protein IPJ76_15855 [Flavobacteriales bacterium]
MRMILPAVLLAAFAACTNGTTGPLDRAKDEERIRARYASMDSLFAADRMGDIAKVYHDSAAVLSVGRVINGRGSIRTYWDMLQGNGVSWDHRIEALHVATQRAIQYGTSELHYRNGQDTLISFVHYTLIWRKDAQGEWWIERDHYTPMPRVVVE